MDLIYADWAATAPLHPAALETLRRFLADPRPANPSAVHTFGRDAADLLEKARTDLARALGWDGQVIFTSGGTESDGIAVFSLLKHYQNTNRRRVILSPFEHPAVREAVYTFAPPMGFIVEECAATPDGVVDIADFAAHLDVATHLDAATRLQNDVAFAAVLAVQNETGVIQPVDALAKMTHDRGGMFLSDCVQAVGHIPLPKEPDILTLSGHKFGGPGGTGALLAKPNIPLSPLLKGGGQEGGIRGGTENLMNLCAMVSAACAVAQTGEAERMAPTRDRLEEKLLAEMAEYGIPVSIAGRDANRIGSTSCVVLGAEATSDTGAMPTVSNMPTGENIVLSCDLAGLAVSAGSACHSGTLAPSKTLLSMGYTAEEAIRQVRLSFGSATKTPEMERAYKILSETILRLR